VQTKKNRDLTQRRYSSTTRLLSRFSAAWCGLSLLTSGAWVTAIAGNSIDKTLANAGQGGFGGRRFAAGVLLDSVIFPLIILALGVASARFLLRVRPPPIILHQGRGRSGAAARWVVFIGLCILGLFLIILLLLSITLSVLADDAKVPLNIAVGLLFAIFWVAGFIGLLICRHRRPRSFLDRPFVVCLRRFSSFSDRAVIALILKQAAYDVPIVFLTSLQSRPGDWDPHLVGLAGLKLSHPWRSAPIVIRIQDDAWQGAAEELIRRAQTILIDTSETSNALRTEVEMIDRAGRWSDAACLRNLAPNANFDKDPVGLRSGLRKIEYTKSWVRATPRMVMGLLIVLAAYYFLMASLSIVEWRFSSLLSGGLLVVAVAYYCSVFVLPTINRKAKLALRKALRNAAYRNSEALQGIGGWLILPVIGLVTVPIIRSYRLVSDYWDIFWDSGWNELTTPGSLMYHYLWAPVIASDIIATLVSVSLAIATLSLLFRKSKATPAFAIAFAGLDLVVKELSYFFAERIPAVAQQAAADTAVDSAGFFVAVIWILYFILSRRVKATFVR
jgi:hypothetical protein